MARRYSIGETSDDAAGDTPDEADRPMSNLDVPKSVASADPGDALKEGHVFVRVALRRSLTVPKVIGSRYEGDVLVEVMGRHTAHAGEIVQVRHDEVHDLRIGGFIEHGATLLPPVFVADATVTGPTVNGRPGGVVSISPEG